MKMTSFDLENDLKVKFRCHILKAFKKFHNTLKFEQNRLNRFRGMTISLKSEEKEEEEKKIFCVLRPFDEPSALER